MSVFANLVGQPEASEVLQAAALASRDGGGAMSHAWLITGPPGSGRSVAATVLAAALQCQATTPGCGECHECQTVMGNNHPDVEHLTTEGTTITVEQVRQLVSRAQASPTVGQWRVIIVEDADRMAERTTNVLLKAIEEPPPRTVWLLCTPSPRDVLPTIRSRCRHLSLAIPRADDVAELLVTRHGLDSQLAHVLARASQSHIGRANGLATDESERSRRHDTLAHVSAISSVSDAVRIAGAIMETVSEQAEATVSNRNATELADLRESLGLSDGEPIPPGMRGQFKNLEDEQKRRATRSQRDALDRVMLDILSLYRDVLLVQLGSDVDIINADFGSTINKLAGAATPLQTIEKMDAISLARRRISANVAPLLALEDLLVSVRPRVTR